MDNRRVLLAVLLSMIVIIGWQLLFPPPEPPAPPVVRPSAEEGIEAPVSPDVAARAEEEPAAEADRFAEPASEGADRSTGDTAIGAEREEVVVLEGDGYRAELSNRGGQLVSLSLAGYQDGEKGTVDLVRDRQELAYPFGLVGPDGGPLPIGDELFAVESDAGEGVGAGTESVVFRYAGPSGRVTKRFSVEPDGLLAVQIEADLATPWAIALGPGLRNPSAIDEERKFKYRGVVYLADGDIETLGSEKVESEVAIPGPGLSWIGIEDTYFLAAVVPRTPIDRALVEPWLVRSAADGAGGAGGAPSFTPMPPGGPRDGDEDLRRELQVVLVPEGDTFSATAYMGAKDLERLKALPWRLQDTVRLGWFGFLARFFLVGLKWIYANVVPNYGWAIVLMTFAIKLVLLPLTHKSYVSMQKMQELAPRIKALRAKYKGKLRDKKGRPDIEQQRKMNEEVAALYRSEGVNPAGGCLPMLLQFPVLIGFYSLLSHAIELRGAPWILWIDDLSMHDPIYVLPIVMGAVQFLQQRTAPAMGDPMQRRLMMAMPVVFTFLFMGFPSGLVLYWLTNNVLTLVQQLVYQRIKARQAAEPRVA